MYGVVYRCCGDGQRNKTGTKMKSVTVKHLVGLSKRVVDVTKPISIKEKNLEDNYCTWRLVGVDDSAKDSLTNMGIEILNAEGWV